MVELETRRKELTDEREKNKKHFIRKKGFKLQTSNLKECWFKLWGFNFEGELTNADIDVRANRLPNPDANGTIFNLFPCSPPFIPGKYMYLLKKKL